MIEDRGSATVVMAAVVGLLAAVAVATAALATLYSARAQAQTAADAAALAAAVATYPSTGATPPRSAARFVAQENGAVVLACGCQVDSGLSPRTVVVSTGVRASVPIFGTFTVRATSRAEFDPMRWLGW